MKKVVISLSIHKDSGSPIIRSLVKMRDDIFFRRDQRRLRAKLWRLERILIRTNHKYIKDLTPQDIKFLRQEAHRLQEMHYSIYRLYRLIENEVLCYDELPF